MADTDRHISKWQKASVEITNLRFQLGKILDDKFSDEEKETKKYKQLLETVDTLFDHVLGDYRKQLDEQKEKEHHTELEKLKNKSKIVSKRTFIIAVVSAVVAELAKTLITLIFI